MKLTRRQGLGGAAGLALAAGPAWGQSRAETLRQVTGNIVNTLDPTLPGSTREAFGISMNVYDRLVAFERKPNGKGFIFDPDHLRPELAKSFAISPDGLTITFKLKPDAKWHDGSPVTAEDVKWSLDRAVAAKSLAPPQLLTGSLTQPEQFTVLDPETVQVKIDRPDRLAAPNLATVYAIMINSKLARQHATAEDPWAQAWLKENTAAGGAYVVESFKPGEQVILRRNEAWGNGPGGKLPFFRRIIAQTVPDPSTRANLVERGDADLSVDLPSSDVIALEQRGKLLVVSTPQFNAFTFIGFNLRMKPFDNVRVRQAIAAALPYQDMFQASIFGRGAPLFGGTWTEQPSETRFPQPMPFRTDLERAKKLLAEAGLAQGFETSFSFNVGSAQVSEPMAALVKESLAKIGIKVDIQKLTDAQASTAAAEKKLPFFTETSIAWLPSTDYFFRNFFTGDQRWNYSGWTNQEVVDVAQKARFELDPAAYDVAARRLIALEAEQVPLLLLWQANQDAVMSPSLRGYTYWFHRQVDFRDLSRV